MTEKKAKMARIAIIRGNGIGPQRRLFSSRQGHMEHNELACSKIKGGRFKELNDELTHSGSVINNFFNSCLVQDAFARHSFIIKVQKNQRGNLKPWLWFHLRFSKAQVKRLAPLYAELSKKLTPMVFWIALESR